jgi:predicted O-linked N-acetylglucosamine transferase (SPINDLY family)
MRLHSVAFFLLPLIQNHNNSDFEITCYDTGGGEDPVTKLFKARADRWVGLDKMSDDEATEKIREDKIDILVDCSGHTGGHRLMMFARKPAPVQVTFLGYPNTTGLSAIDYRLTDRRADPSALNDSLASEYLHRLPNSAWCFNPLTDPYDVADSPFLEKGFVTFGTFNAFVKMNEPMMRNWVRIVKSTRNSRLILKNNVMKDPVFLQRVEQTLLKMGMERERFDLIPHQKSREDHFRSFGMLDIALDTFPYTGTTGSCETLYNGVPIVTLAGKTHVSRVGASLLHSVGLDNLVAETDEDYVRIAVELANDPFRLTDIRANLRQRMMESPLMDGPAYARDVEDAYRIMWRHWCGQRGGK